jgi:hypothetical protein
MIQQGLSQNYKYAMYAEHIYLVWTTTDVSQTISLEKHTPFFGSRLIVFRCTLVSRPCEQS